MDKHGFGEMESDDFAQLAKLRETLDIKTEIPFTVLSFADIRLQRYAHELKLAHEALKRAKSSLEELEVPSSSWCPDLAKGRKNDALRAIKKALKPYKALT